MNGTQNERLQHFITDSLKAQESLRKQACAVFKIAQRIVKCHEDGGIVYAFGNGGSAGDAEHLVAELLGRYRVLMRPPVAAIALTGNTSLFSALANDFGYQKVFTRQLKGLLNSDSDLVIGISTSGNSMNVVQGLKFAYDNSARTVGLLGMVESGCECIQFCDLAVVCPDPHETARIQEMHRLAIHLICEIVDDLLKEY